MDWLDNVKWDEDGLVPVIAQEQGSKDVLMFAWMNREALAAFGLKPADVLAELQRREGLSGLEEFAMRKVREREEGAP